MNDDVTLKGHEIEWDTDDDRGVLVVCKPPSLGELAADTLRRNPHMVEQLKKDIRHTKAVLRDARLRLKELSRDD